MTPIIRSIHRVSDAYDWRPSPSLWTLGDSSQNDGPVFPEDTGPFFVPTEALVPILLSGKLDTQQQVNS